jgi:16S rRNA (cytosine1402-N4)-methyltransferase
MHTSVLLREVIDGLAIQKGDIVVDATLGGGGHAEAILQVFGDSITFVGFDTDSSAIDRVGQRLQQWHPHLINANFRSMQVALENVGISKIDRIMFDLGISSFQLEASGRGISFSKDEPLVMTLSDSPTEETLTARDIVNAWDEEAIANVLYAYGEETYARRIAKGIVTARKVNPIETTFALVEIIKQSVPKAYTYGKKHCATKTFQALRIAVNDELGALKEGLKKGYEVLNKGGRFAVISFHSLEDRIVKEFFKEKLNDEAIIITKKPITAKEQEILENPRSRSAKLRVLEKNK